MPKPETGDAKFNETLKRMLGTPPKPHQPKEEKPPPAERKAARRTQKGKEPG